MGGLLEDKLMKRAGQTKEATSGGDGESSQTEAQNQSIGSRVRQKPRARLQESQDPNRGGEE